MGFDLDRFLIAQDDVYAAVHDELAAGRKTGHWMWFIFPQLAGLGRTPQSRFYAIASIAEARAYLRHPVLGPRLEECTSLVIRHRDRALLDIFGAVDALKFCSSMTLFGAAAEEEQTLFHEALMVKCGGQADALTLMLLKEQDGQEDA